VHRDAALVTAQAQARLEVTQARAGAGEDQRPSAQLIEGDREAAVGELAVAGHEQAERILAQRDAVDAGPGERLYGAGEVEPGGLHRLFQLLRTGGLG
jgi:hypothetical protein